jgi:hypothetical protein
VWGQSSSVRDAAVAHAIHFDQRNIITTKQKFDPSLFSTKAFALSFVMASVSIWTLHRAQVLAIASVIQRYRDHNTSFSLAKP